MPAFIDMTGQTYGRLTAIRYVGRGKSNKPFWLFNCACGEQKEINGADVRSGRIKTCGCSKKENLERIAEVRRGAVPGYRALHMRIEASKGKAKEHKCVDCGADGFHWSYSNSADVEYSQLVTQNGKSAVMTYALDLDQYQARCYKCHRAYDGLF